MIQLTPVLASHQQLLNQWFDGDSEGQKELSSYKDIESWLKLLNPISRFGWIVYENDRPIGLSDLEITESHVAYFSFYIAPDERGKGKGKELLRALIKQAKDMGIKQLEAGAAESNIASQKALAAVGFFQEGRDKDNYLVFKINL